MNVDSFKKTTGYDIGSFFQKFKVFCENEYPLIVGYYQGGTMSPNAFSTLKQLTQESSQIEGLFENYPSTKTNLDVWELLDIFSEIQSKLCTINNSSKWLRSSRRDNISPSVSINRFLRTNENFERVSQDLGGIDPQNDWTDIAIPNYCFETNYTDSQGTLYKVNLQNSEGFEIDNVVDNLVGETVLGKDIDKEFSFEDNDVRTVEYQECIRQTLDTISSTVKGDLPEFPNYGIPTEFVGNNVNSIQYPILMKSILNMFQRDSRWREVELLGIKLIKDSVFVDLKCVTILNDTHITNLKV